MTQDPRPAPPLQPASNRWRTPALAALWVQAASVFGLSAFVLWQSSLDDWLSALSLFLAGLTLVWWTQVFGRLTAGERLPPDDGTLRSLALLYPWLTTLRLVRWGLTSLALLAGMAPTANPVALVALVTIWGGTVWAGNAVNAALVRLAYSLSGEGQPTVARPMPAQRSGQPAAAPSPQQLTQRLAEWLNLSAALSLGLTVVNLVPIQGLGMAPDLASQLAYGVKGVIEVVATLLAFQAIRALGRAQPT